MVTKPNIESHYFLFAVLLMVCIVALFLTLQPKVAALLFPQLRAKMRNNFLSQVQQQHDINPQLFWQFREFYSPGSFTFFPQYEDLAGGLVLKNSIAPITKVPILDFHSPFITSSDSLIFRENWQKYMNVKNISAHDVLFQNPTTLIYQAENNQLKIIFVKPIEEMQIANGFFDYTDQEKQLLQNRYWLDETTVY